MLPVAYLANLLLGIIVMYDHEQASDAVWTQLLTVYSLLISGGIAILTQGMSRFHSSMTVFLVMSPLVRASSERSISGRTSNPLIVHYACRLRDTWVLRAASPARQDPFQQPQTSPPSAPCCRLLAPFARTLDIHESCGRQLFHGRKSLRYAGGQRRCHHTESYFHPLPRCGGRDCRLPRVLPRWSVDTSHHRDLRPVYAPHCRARIRSYTK